MTSSVASDERVGSLRGAAAPDVSLPHLRVAAAGICVVTLAVLSTALFVAGAHKNAQISGLREHGVPVSVTVTGCMGLLGGSGSNPAGYACRGTYTLDGRRFNRPIPGDVLREPGSTMAAVAVPQDPGLLATAAQMATERPSASVYIVPAVLLGLLAVLITALAIRWRRSHRQPRRPLGAAVVRAPG